MAWQPFQEQAEKPGFKMAIQNSGTSDDPYGWKKLLADKIE